MLQKYILYQIFELRYKLQGVKLWHSYEHMLFNFQQHIEKALFDAFLGTGLSWTSPLSEIKIGYSHIVIHTFIRTVMKD